MGILENLRFGRRPQPLDIVNAAPLQQLEELLQVAHPLFIGPAVRHVSDARDSGAGAEPDQRPVAAGIHFHRKYFQARDGNPGHIVVRWSRHGGWSNSEWLE